MFKREYPTKAQLMARLAPNHVEAFYVTARDAAENRAQLAKSGATDDGSMATKAGWYYWTCLPGCLPDSEPFGPYRTPFATLRAAYDADFLPDSED